MIALIVAGVLLAGLIAFVLVRQSDRSPQHRPEPRPAPEPRRPQIRLFVQTDKEGDDLDAILADAQMAQEIIQTRMRENLAGHEFRFVPGVFRLRPGVEPSLAPGEKAGVWVDGPSPFEGQAGGAQIGGDVAWVSLDTVPRIWHRWHPNQTNRTGGWREAAMIHDLFHLLGMVPEDAPNFAGKDHVDDDPADIMYYAWIRDWHMDEDGADYRQLLLDSPYIREA